MFPTGTDRVVREALRALGVRNLVLGIHDPAFPGVPGDDAGRGSPYSRGAERFFAFAASLGFSGVQLGPQGQTSLVNPSPYDGTTFSRNVLSIALRELCDPGERQPLLSASTLARIADGARGQAAQGRVPYRYAFVAQHRALGEAFANFEREDKPELREQLAVFWQRHEPWLERDALYQVLTEVHRGLGFRDWTNGAVPHSDQSLWNPPAGQHLACQNRREALLREHRRTANTYAFSQMLVHEQHAALRARCRSLGLDLLGDFQVGLANQDVFSYASLVLDDYVMGAPPSRTTPTGQAWDYAVLDPQQCNREMPGRDGALRLLLARMDKMFDEYDAIRIDHPHGFVCPWVYRPNQPDPLFAVQHGARLFSSPDLPDHPALARYAIVDADQLRRSVPRYADDWEIDLRPAQIDRFAIFLDAMIDSARRHGREKQGLICEVLSTLPRPLRAILERHGLGRFRVVQKANPDDRSDVYRVENAEPEDWVMAGNHDTPPIWTVAKGWRDSGKLDSWTRMLAAELGLRANALAENHGLLVHAVFASMFASAAENVSVFFTDLFGLDYAYNTPGTVNDDNWSLRLGPDFERGYDDRLARGEALNLPMALAMAVAGRGQDFLHAHAPLVAELERRSGDSVLKPKLFDAGR
jgi:4-alpha-glucanotransferase